MVHSLQILTAQGALPFLNGFGANHRTPAMRLPLIGGEAYDISTAIDPARAQRLVETGTRLLEDAFTLCAGDAAFAAIPHTQNQWYVQLHDEESVAFHHVAAQQREWNEIAVSAYDNSVAISLTNGNEARSVDMLFHLDRQDARWCHAFNYNIQMEGAHLASLALFCGLAETAPLESIEFQLLMKMGANLEQFLQTDKTKSAIANAQTLDERLLRALKNDHDIIIDETTIIEVDHAPPGPRTNGYILFSLKNRTGNLFALPKVVRPLWNWTGGYADLIG